VSSYDDLINEGDSLKNLQEKARFLREEKRKIIAAKKAQEEIKNLEAEIKNLSDENSLNETSLKENADKLKQGLGISVGIAAKEIEALKNKVKDLSSDKKETTTLISNSSLENEVASAVNKGRWTVEEDQIEREVHRAELEEKWQAKKKQQEIEAKKGEKMAAQGLLGCLGVLAWFFPIFWPVLIVGLFKTYPFTCYSILGFLVFFLIILISIGSA